jgi:hypothetical protein
VHLAPADLRAVRWGDAVMRFAVLGEITYVDAVVPSDAALGPEADQPCERPHRGVVLEGGFELERPDARHPIEARTAFHVPGGAPPHRHRMGGPARVLAFESSVDDLNDAELRRLGLEPVTRPGPMAVGWTDTRPTPATGRVEAEFAVLGSWVLTVARLGPRGGFANDYCDAPHWGSVLAGSVTIEWEDDVELLSAGDVYRCEPGPPGHRMLSVGPATVIDVTPVSVLHAPGRLIPWRRGGFRQALATVEGRSLAGGVELARVG